MSPWTELLQSVEQAEPSPGIPARALARAAELGERPGPRRGHRAITVVVTAAVCCVVLAALVIAAHSRSTAPAPANPTVPHPKKPVSHLVVNTLPDGTRHLFPPDAEVGKARKIISFRATNRSQVYLWLVPLARGGHCFISNGAHGLGQPPSICALPDDVSPSEPTSSSPGSSPPDSSSVFVGGFEHPVPVVFFGLAKPAVATVELRFQNGDRERLTPIDGFVLHDLGPAHWEPGTRLVAAVALDRTGKALSTERFLNPQAPGIYPCGNVPNVCP